MAPTTTPSGGRTAPGTMIGGRYALRAAVGHGGMGTVWRAADTLLRRDVAVKEVISPPGLAPSDRDAMYERTLREARAAAALSHPAVVQVYDVVTENGRPWIVMELLDARSLADIVIEDGPLAPRAVAKIGIALLGALEVAHAAGVLHRDVKPANVLIAADGRCVLTDFGVARMPTDVQLTTPGMVLGSPHFISPERAMGGPFGPPSDLFSLGVTLYTAVEGRPPFDKGDPIETMHAVVEDPPAPMSRSGALSNVLYGLLEKDPSRRFDVATARALLRDLLTGALASQAQGHMMTDPYAVVPSQRGPAPTPPQPPAAAKPKPTGKIGGPAMLGPGESLTDRLKKLRAEAGKTPSGAGKPAAAKPAGPEPALDETSPNLAGQAWDVPTGAGAPPGPTTGPAADPTDPGSADVTAPISPAAQPGSAARPGTGDLTAKINPARPGTTYPATADRTTQINPPRPGMTYPAPADRTAPINAAHQFGTPPQYGGMGPATPGGGWPAAGAPYPPNEGTVHGGGNSALGGVRRIGDQLATAVRGWSRSTRIAAAAGVALVLLVGVVLVATGGDESTTPPPVSQGASQPPASSTQSFTGLGVTLNVPKDWRQASSEHYVDFIDPDGSGRRVRILAEKASAEPTRFMEIAESGLKKKSKSCAKPYTRVDLRDAELAGEPAAELEYTCGEGDTMRHGVWRAIVTGGTAHSFYLTTPADRFDESKAIFDEMVNSFKLASA